MQQRVLAFTRALAQTAPQGVPGRKLLRFAGTIPLEDVQLMQEAIEQGCDQGNSGTGRIMASLVTAGITGNRLPEGQL